MADITRVRRVSAAKIDFRTLHHVFRRARLSSVVSSNRRFNDSLNKLFIVFIFLFTGVLYLD